MPQGGELRIVTANTQVAPDPGAPESPLSPGEYVRITVSDTGVGMDAGIQAHIFEPFFTTKERGQGTGLGLPTVYGIVKRNEGDIQVHSEIDRGTTFEIYFPRSDEVEKPATRPPSPPTLSDHEGSETILLVEDEPAVRSFAARILTEQGYHMLTAGNGQEAIQLVRGHDGRIDLLVTDVVMPGMNGKELVEQIKRLQPGVRILYMSGYSDDLIAHHDVPNHGTSFLAKPFSLETLGQKVRDLLDTAPEQGAGEDGQRPQKGPDS
jgi:CheY-like chemotaxis protein